MRVWTIVTFLIACGLPGCQCGGDVDGNDDADGGGRRDGGGVNTGALVITPANPVLDAVAGMPAPTVTFTAAYNGAPVAAAWSTDRAELGAIDSTGTYRALGTLGGKATVRAVYSGETATTSVSVHLQVSENGDPKCGNPGTIGAGGYGGVGGDGPGCPVSPATLTTLKGVPPTADGAIKWLYPYDGTVFPRGLLAPLLMWSPGGHAFDALRLELHAKSGSFVYDGTFARPTAGPFINLPIPQATWTQMSYSASGDEVTVTVTFAQGSQTFGPLTLKWLIAPGTLKGVVYYNSYGTALVQNSGEPSCGPADSGCGSQANRHGPAFGGATLAIKANGTDPVLVAGSNSADESGCRVCHSVASNGARLVTQRGDAYGTSRLYALTSGNAESGLGQGNAAFPALAPDGARFFSSAGGMVDGDAASALYDLPAGTRVMGTSGLPANLKAALPAFAPDGKNLVFNFYGGPTGADAKSLAVMSFDPMTLVFGAIDKVYTPGAGEIAVWPSFVPTSKAVVFELESNSNEWGFTRGGNRGRLYWVDLASKQGHALDKLNGVGYLPTSAVHPDDTTLNYEPTVNPVASGGYAWVVFTSRRLYGNVATIDPFQSDPRVYDWQNKINTKKLWVAAVDLNAQPGTDPSHPAFYLPAQEIKAGNSRGFWTVDPCRPDGAGCETGDECCGGYCVQPAGGTMLVCGSQKPMCANEFERCDTDQDCCQSGGIDSSGPPLTCVNHYCVTSSPPIP